MLKRLIVVFTLILYLAIVVFTFIKLNSSLSPLKPFIFYSDNNNPIPKSAEIKLKTPFISEKEFIFCIAEIRLSDQTQFALCKLLPEQNKAEIVFGFDTEEVFLSGFAKDDNITLLLLENNKSDHQCLRIQDDTVFRFIPVPVLNNETITALGMTDGNPEIITITDSIPSTFKKYSALSRKEFQWEQKLLRFNSFFARISTPLGAYYKNNWFFLSTSEFYRRDSLYVNVPQGTTNIMLFRNNLSYHFDDIRIHEKPFSREKIDQTFSGILKPEHECSVKYIYNPYTSEFKQISCPEEEWSNIPVFTIHEQYPERFPLHKKIEDGSFSVLSVIEGKIIQIMFTTDPKTNRTIFRFPGHEDEEFSKTSGSFSDMYFIPHKNDYIFILDNGHFCKIDNTLERTDNVSFQYKTTAFVKLFTGQLLQQPEKFNSFAVPFILAGYPALVIAALFIFFIVRVFLTPRRPSYSSRKKKKTPLVVYLVPAALIYFAAFFVFIFNFISLLKFI